MKNTKPEKNKKTKAHFKHSTRRKTQKDVSKVELDSLFAEGQSAVFEYVRAAPEKIEYIVSKDSEYNDVESFLLDCGLKTIKHHHFDEWCDASEQGTIPRAPIFAKLRLKLLSENEYFENPKLEKQQLILALDHLQDPHNLGAIARSAAFFGVKTIFIPKARQVAYTRASVATSQGAFAYINIVHVVNLNRTLKKLKSSDYWVLGADMDGEPIGGLAGFYEKVVLVLGNEQKGLSRLVRENCDRTVKVDRKFGKLESLNVSVAAGILLHHLAK